MEISKLIQYVLPQFAIVGALLTSKQHQCIQNLTAVLAEAGTDINKVVKVNVFLSNMDDFAKMNEVYMTYWGDVKPSRTYVFVLRSC